MCCRESWRKVTTTIIISIPIITIIIIIILITIMMVIITRIILIIPKMCSTLIWKKDGRMISAGRTVIRKDPRMSLVIALKNILRGYELDDHKEAFYDDFDLDKVKIAPSRWTRVWRSWRCDRTTREPISATLRLTGNLSTRLTLSMSLCHPPFRSKIVDLTLFIVHHHQSSSSS